MTEQIGLPTYETLLIEAIRSLAVDSGTVTSTATVGTNCLNDASKNWAAGVHENRLVKIVRGRGAGQVAVVEGNSAQSLVIKGAWAVGLDTTSIYVILEKDLAQILRNVLGGGSDISAANPLEVHDPKVGSLISYEGTTTADGAADGSTLVCGGLAGQPDYDGNQVIITSGPYIGQARDIVGATNGGTINPHQNFGGQITQGTTFTIAALRTVPAEVAALAADIGNASASALGSLYAILGNPATALAIRLGNPDAHTLTNLADKLGNIARSLDLILGARWDAAGDLGTDIGDILADIGNASASALGSLYAILGNPSATIASMVDDLEPRLGDPSGDTLATIAAKWGDIARSLDLILGSRWDAAGDLGTDIANILANIAEIPLWNTPNTGAHTTAGATEETILTTTLSNPFRLWFLIDLSNIAGGDTFVLRVYQRVDGTNLRLKDQQQFSDSQTIQVYEIDGIYGDGDCNIQITIQRTAGVDRAFPHRWNILKEP